MRKVKSKLQKLAHGCKVMKAQWFKKHLWQLDGHVEHVANLVIFHVNSFFQASKLYKSFLKVIRATRLDRYVVIGCAVGVVDIYIVVGEDHQGVW